MAQRTIDAAAIEAEVDQIRSLGIDALRARWRMLFGAVPPKSLSKVIMGRSPTGSRRRRLVASIAKR
jgi:hypothetical protein